MKWELFRALAVICLGMLLLSSGIVAEPVLTVTLLLSAVKNQRVFVLYYTPVANLGSNYLMLLI